MPDPSVASLKQTALLWAATGTDQFGQHSVATMPVEIPVRWETGRGEYVDRQGNTVSLDATVFVDREIPVGSRMWLGTASEFMGTGSAGEETEIHEVMKYHAVPDIKGRLTTRFVGLMRFRDRQ